MRDSIMIRLTPKYFAAERWKDSATATPSCTGQATDMHQGRAAMDQATRPDQRIATDAGPAAAPPTGRDLAGLRRITLIALVLAVLVFAYYVAADRTTPVTTDARVQAFVHRMGPGVAGPVLHVNVDRQSQSLNPRQ